MLTQIAFSTAVTPRFPLVPGVLCANKRCSSFIALSILALTFAAARAPARAADNPLDAEELAGRIDHFLAIRQNDKGIQSALRCDDAAFIRRVYLDLAGCIPSIVDVRDFLDDPRSDKRRRWVEMLLTGQKPSRKPDAFSRHFANVWRAWVLSCVNRELADSLAFPIEKWFQQRLQEDAPFDRMVREMLANSSFDDSGVSPNFFYKANEFKAEKLVSSTSRLLLGIKLECAQCHEDRSGGSWTQSQFWSFAVFFAGFDPEKRQVSNKRQIEIPGKKKTVRARFLSGSEPVWKSGDNPRAVLADWLVNAKNPYFARAAVNRLWAYFFGIGLTDPVDGQGSHNPPSHPELLDELAGQFAGHGFDLKYLVRALVGSGAYQRSSVGSTAGPSDPRLFARMAVRGLSAEQLFDSVAEAAEYPDTLRQETRQQFLLRFAPQGKPIEASTSILQALYLMNGSFMAERIRLEGNKTLATLVEQETSEARRIETLFLVVLSRKPTVAESVRIAAYLERGGSSADRREALADVFWALLNSPEFFLNH